MGEGSEVGGLEHLGEKELPKQLPSFIWPASNCPTHTCSISPSFSLRKHTNTQSFAPPPHVFRCGPHRGQPPNPSGPISSSSLPPLSFNCEDKWIFQSPLPCHHTSVMTMLALQRWARHEPNHMVSLRHTHEQTPLYQSNGVLVIACCFNIKGNLGPDGIHSAWCFCPTQTTHQSGFLPVLDQKN